MVLLSLGVKSLGSHGEKIRIPWHFLNFIHGNNRRVIMKHFLKARETYRHHLSYCIYSYIYIGFFFSRVTLYTLPPPGNGSCSVLYLFQFKSSIPIVGLTSCFFSRIRLGSGHLGRFLPLTWFDSYFIDVSHHCIILCLKYHPTRKVIKCPWI